MQETIEHFIMYCPFYRAKRVNMFHNLKVNGILNITFHQLIGGGDQPRKKKEIINREITRFLMATGRIPNL